MKNFFLRLMILVSAFGISSAVQAQATNCPASSSSQSVWISNVEARAPGNTTYTNPSGASSYSDYTAPCIVWDYSINLLNLGINLSSAGNYVGYWIDENGNGTFEASENQFPWFNNNPTNGTGYNFSVPSGLQGALALRIIISTNPITGPCANIQDGEVEDYIMCFGCTPASQNQNVWISRVRKFDLSYDNPSGASAYSDFTNPVIPVAPTDQINITTSAANQFIGVFVDLNDNGVFDANETLVNVQDGGSPGLAFTMNSGFFQNASGCLPIRIIVSSSAISGPCDNVSDGEIEDYILCFECTPASSDQSIWISRVRLFDLSYDNPSGPSAYSDFTSPVIVAQGPSPQLNISVTEANRYIAMYIDINNNGIFEANEAHVNTQDGGNPGIGVALSGGILTGAEGCYDVRIIYSKGPISGPCHNPESGEVEEYTICFPCTPASSDQSIWISRVRLFDLSYDNPSGPSAYSDFTSPAIIASLSSQINISVTTANQFIAVYFDVNKNGLFEANEAYVNQQDGGNPGIGIGLGGGILTGAEGCMGMRIIYSNAAITGPCDDPAVGEVEDYEICFGKPCTPVSADQSRWITNVRVFEWPGGWIYQNPSGPSAYSDFTSPAISLSASSSFSQMNISVTAANQFIAFYVDVNNNGTFEANEAVYNGQDGGGPGLGIGLSGGILTGIQGCHDVRWIYSSSAITGPCDDIESGEIEDYTICWGEKLGDDKGGSRKTVITDKVPEMQINVFPQPATDMANLQIELPMQQRISVIVTDMQGRTVARILSEETLGAGTHTIPLNVSGYGQGVYFIAVQTANGTMTQKLVVL